MSNITFEQHMAALAKDFFNEEGKTKDDQQTAALKRENEELRENYKKAMRLLEEQFNLRMEEYNIRGRWPSFKKENGLK